MNDDVSYSEQCTRGRKLADEILKAGGDQARILAAKFCCDLERGAKRDRGVLVGFVDRLIGVARNGSASAFMSMFMSAFHIL